MKESTHICHITIGHNPTDDRIFHKEVKTLAERYQNISIIAPDRLDPGSYIGIKFHLFREIGFFRNLFRAYKIARALQADLYHVHEFEFLPFALILKYKYKKKIIYDAHETIYYYFTEFTRRSKLITFIPAVVAQALEWGCSHFTDHIITVTPWVAKGFKPFHKHISLIYNYPIVEMFDKTPQQYVPKNQPVILYHGQLASARNIHIMVKSMVYVREKFPGAKLLIIGGVQQWYKEQLDQIISDNHLEKSVEFRPPVPYTDIPELIQFATLGLSSMMPNESFKRSIQIKPFEFMCVGIPVLGCRVPSTEIYIEQTGSGMLVDPPTAENLGAITIHLLSHPEIMQQMGVRGRQAVRKQFNWSKMKEPLFKIYEKVLTC